MTKNYSTNLNYWYINRNLDKKALRQIINWLILDYEGQRTGEVLERLKRLGFESAMQAGISISAGDLTPPPMRDIYVASISEQVLGANRHYNFGQLSGGEKAQRAIDGWFSATEILRRSIVKYFNKFDPVSPVGMMAFSGARGNITQVRQLMGMRGLMLDPLGQIITSPIRTSFREGLTVTEYLISSYGARKGLIDTALRTANAGYLTRRLVDVLQDIVIRRLDCQPIIKTQKTLANIKLVDLKNSSGKTILPLKERLIGRILAEPISTSKTTFETGLLLNRDLAEYIAQIQPNGVRVRSPITCSQTFGCRTADICQLCYGWDLSLGELVSIGEAVGILAAQSIGEPGTQLTMRTFHTGGVISGQATDRLRSSAGGRVIFPKRTKGRLIRSDGGMIGFYLYESCTLLICRQKNTRIRYTFPPNTILFTRHGQWIYPMQDLAQLVDDAQLSRTNWQQNQYLVGTLFSGFLYEKTKQKTNKGLWVLSASHNTYKNKLFKFGDWVNKPKINYPAFEVQKHSLNCSFGVDLVFLNREEAPSNSQPGQILDSGIKSHFDKTKRLQEIGRVVSWSRNYISIQRMGGLLIPAESSKVGTSGSVINAGMKLGKLTFFTPSSGDIAQTLPKIDALFEAQGTAPIHSKIKSRFKALLKTHSLAFAARNCLLFAQINIRDELQKLYLDQGIDINDRHIELVVRQMASSVEFSFPPYNNFDVIPFWDAEPMRRAFNLIGSANEQTLNLPWDSASQSNNLTGEDSDLTFTDYEEFSKKIKQNRLATYQPILIGITQASLGKEGFLAPASFQETVRVLTRSALIGRYDTFKGLKECIVAGVPVKMGTYLLPN